ncbi:hypothetical protein TNIN_296451 [Trichonephila inaurata madagascariensis]|uniref:Uncharacterized protein n=1 Tax=Trichonephila inaurata madagascariensis TaxID=2747483 RepID=A0A8X6JVW1_9ARAC|nr:hypothetical protein TNIN_296451 [Trichonephila inaurata madagascariensis]
MRNSRIPSKNANRWITHGEWAVKHSPELECPPHHWVPLHCDPVCLLEYSAKGSTKDTHLIHLERTDVVGTPEAAYQVCTTAAAKVPRVRKPVVLEWGPLFEGSAKKLVRCVIRLSAPRTFSQDVTDWPKHPRR